MGALLAWAMASGIQTWRDIAVLHRAPIPSEFVASGLVFGGLSLIDGPTNGLGGLVGWGLLIALTLQAGGPAKLIQGGAKGTVGKVATPQGCSGAQSSTAPVASSAGSGSGFSPSQALGGSQGGQGTNQGIGPSLIG